MGFDLSSGDDVRNATIRSGLRGYHKDDVDEFRDAVAELVDDLRRRADVASGHLAQLGLDEPLDLKQEFVTVGREVSAILEAARTAATDIRQRATADGERWREEAASDAERMRTDAWDESTAHLESAVTDAEQSKAAADEDALFIRAQAEKEAIRLTSEAKRDAEEAIRTARAEAESIIAASRESAEAAQERTRALEVRREELMGELEEARKAIGAVEAEMDDQHKRLMSPETTTVRIIDQAGEDSEEAAERESGWLDEDATVRLVSTERPRPTPVAELEPVLDADDIVAEVERLQVDPSVDDPWSDRFAASTPPEPSPATPAVVAEPAPLESVGGPLPPGDVADAPMPVDEAVEAPAKETQDEPAPVVAVEDEPATEASVEPAFEDEPPQSEDEPGDNERVDEEPPADGLAGLFASLRSPTSAPEPAPAPVAPIAEQPADTATEASEAQEDAAPEYAVGSPLSGDDEDDGIAEQETALLPMTNRALRTVKKQILEFQNVMLEATKADPDGWRPDAEEYRLALDPHVQALVDEAHRAAGGDGASTLTVEFGGALSEAVDGAVSTMAGAGYRETSASLGRVFRAWRSDEAERRLSALAAEAYQSARAARHPS